MKLMISLVSFLAAIPFMSGAAVASEPSRQSWRNWSYTSACAEAVGGGPAASHAPIAEALRILREDLGDLDAQLRILRDPKESDEFKDQVGRTAESTRQAVLFDADELRKLNAPVAGVVISQCEIKLLQKA